MAVVNLSDASIKTGGKRTTFWDQVTDANAGLQLISTQTFSAVSSVTFDNVFSDNYIQYKIVARATGTTLAGINWQFRTGGSTYTSANYRWQTALQNSGGRSMTRSTGQVFWQNALGAVDNNQGYTGVMEIINPYQTAYTNATGWVQYSASQTTEIRGFGISVTDSFDGFYAATSSGTMTGVISVYGYYKGV